MPKYLILEIYKEMLPVYKNTHIVVDLIKENPSTFNIRREIKRYFAKKRADNLREMYRNLPGLEGLKIYTRNY